ncbi:porin family protein [Xenorhabdus szentirmaii]|uniref:DUF560 domain-containing protein n=2 Tax=Xenorhabdus szentirmaii TaxID=290112 RepID=W1J1T2_9GAMM|nr:porin family protein [Xenorhabdus szentirmaii]CDL84013.1 conserved exported hypothetical protein [Xenorhabdus szentirmaii DSM 16338]
MDFAAMTCKKKTAVSTLLFMASLALFHSPAAYSHQDGSHEAFTSEESTHWIWKEIRHNQQQNQQKHEAGLSIPAVVSTEEDESKEGKSSGTGHGQPFEIENNPENLAKALYFAINYQRWSEVKRLLAVYQKIPESNPLLVDFAQGGLARIEGKLALSAAHYQKILSQQPNSTRIKLELARVYFEDYNNREAEKLFSELREQHQLPKIVLENIDRYLHAIPLRSRWHSSFSISSVYDDNLNMTPNQEAQCLLILEGHCLMQRKLPKIIKEWGSTYTATLSRRYSFAGHHGVFGRALIYGENYPHYHDANENIFLLVNGYNYKNRTHDLSFGPLFEYKQSAGKTEYYALGAKLEWQWAMTAQTGLNVEISNKRLNYQQNDSVKNGSLSSSYFSLSHFINDKVILFGGGQWSYQDSQRPSSRYQQWGITAGIAGQIYSGINGSLVATLRQLRFAAYNAVLEARRQDNEQIYTASIKFPKAKIVGMTPSLIFRHRHNRSNVDWLYSYDKNQVQIQLEKYF